MLLKCCFFKNCSPPVIFFFSILTWIDRKVHGSVNFFLHNLVWALMNLIFFAELDITMNVSQPKVTQVIPVTWHCWSPLGSTLVRDMMLSWWSLQKVVKLHYIFILQRFNLCRLHFWDHFKFQLTWWCNIRRAGYHFQRRTSLEPTGATMEVGTRDLGWRMSETCTCLPLAKHQPRVGRFSHGSLHPIGQHENIFNWIWSELGQSFPWVTQKWAGSY